MTLIDTHTHTDQTITIGTCLGYRAAHNMRQFKDDGARDERYMYIQVVSLKYVYYYSYAMRVLNTNLYRHT